MRVMHDYTGEKFGKWMVLRFDRRTSSGYNWMCLCECGKIASRKIAGLKHGDSSGCTSCGNRTHNLTGTYISQIFGNIVQRCQNPNSLQYSDYGGRGVKICAYVRSSPASIVELVGHRPNNRYSLDRINNDGHYSCGSCFECIDSKWPMNLRWATRAEQMCNRRGNVQVTMDGVTKTLTEWARLARIHPNTLKNHIKNGKVSATMVVSR